MYRPARNSICALVALTACACGRSGSNSGPSSGPGAGSASGGAGSGPRAGAAAAGALTPITVAAISILDVAPLYLARAEGMFAAEGLDVTVQSTQGGAESVPGVVSGQYQIAFANLITVLLAYGKGLPLKLVAAGDYSSGKPEDFSAVVVPGASRLQTMKDLEGKTLAVNQLNNIGGITVRAAMRKAGGDPDRLTMIEARFPDMPAALGQNRIDAAWVVEPFLTVARNQGARVISWNFAEPAPDLMVGAYITTAEYARSHADVVKHFAAAIDKALVYASEHPDAARAILLTYTRIEKPITLALNLPVWKPQLSRASLVLLADLLVRDKLLPGAPNLDALLP
jgi:NitT/TauT family transport system substrate-binding protein